MPAGLTVAAMSKPVHMHAIFHSVLEVWYNMTSHGNGLKITERIYIYSRCLFTIMGRDSQNIFISSVWVSVDRKVVRLCMPLIFWFPM